MRKSLQPLVQRQGTVAQQPELDDQCPHGSQACSSTIFSQASPSHQVKRPSQHLRNLRSTSSRCRIADPEEIQGRKGQKNKSKDRKQKAKTNAKEEPGQAGRTAMEGTSKSQGEVGKGGKGLSELDYPINHALSTQMERQI